MQPQPIHDTATIGISHPSFIATILINIAAFIATIGTHLELALRIVLLILSVALTARQLYRSFTSKPSRASRGTKLLTLGAGFILICMLCTACASADHALLTSLGTPKPSLTNLLGTLQNANAATAPFDPFAPIVAAGITFATTALGWYAHNRAKSKVLDAQTAHIATLQAAIRPKTIPAITAPVKPRTPVVTQSVLP